MSRPRPPIHDPYGLLRPPPPLETPSSTLYSVTNNDLGSTTSLPLPSALPGRRANQRGTSPGRTQRIGDYDDQPYLANVVRHHGQVTLVPPVNNGRVRKARRRRNPDATASSISLVEPDVRPNPSRPDGEATAHRSPRRPRHGSDTRAVSSPDIHSSDSPYPDYPPPSFEEVLALDRRTAAPNHPTREVTRSETSLAVDLPHLAASVLSSDLSQANSVANTPWEEDRRLGLSLEERVQRELERNIRSNAARSSPGLSDGTPASTNHAPLPGSGTPTSVAASNFLTPPDSTPSPLGIPLPLSTLASPQAELPEPRPPSPPLKSTTPAPSAPSPIQVVEPDPVVSRAAHANHSQTPEQPAESVHASSNREETATPQPALQTISQGSPPKTPGALPSLLFTAKLNLATGPSVDHDTPPSSSSSKGKCKETTNRPASINLSPKPENDVVPRAESPRKALRTRPSTEPIAASSRADPVPSLPARPSLSHPSSSMTRSPLKSHGEIPIATQPAGENPSPALRRPPPPPPPGPRPRSIGASVAARISAYESILVNAPKIPPPIPPRPRERQQASSSSVDLQKAHSPSKVDESVVKLPQRDIERAHTAEELAPRPADLVMPKPGPSRILPVAVASGSRPLPVPPSPIRSSGLECVKPDAGLERMRCSSSSERLGSPVKLVQAQALVPAKIGADGKLEIIPDAEVIWLDENKAKAQNSVQGSSVNRGRSSSRTALEGVDVPRSPMEPVTGSSIRQTPPPSAALQPVGVVSSPSPRASTIEPLNNPFSSPVRSTPVLLPAPLATEQPATRSETRPRLADDFEYTDLDLLISRLEENEAARQGANYEQLLTVGEVLGPAAPHTRAELDLNVGLVEIQRRRVMKDGRVKLKLSLMGVSVDKCGVCLTQFKNNESAVLLPCLHNYHTNCIVSWLVRQDTPACPHCRTPV